MIESELNPKQKDTLCQQYLHILFQQESSLKKTNLNTSIAETDGEILYPSINKLLNQLKLTQNDTFVDLGSGVGKLAMQVFLNSNAKEVIGIEYIATKHQRALSAAHRLMNDIPELQTEKRKLTFVHGDFLQVSFANATVALITSTCFEQMTLDALGDLLNNMTQLHTVLSLRPMLTLQRLPFKKVIRIECSWDTALCYVYMK